MSLKDEPVCSFCGKTRKEVKNFVEGPHSIMICENCIGAAVDIIKKAKTDEGTESNQFNLTPIEIFEKLEQYVIGQTSAKKTLATEVREHYKRINAPVIDDVEMEKSNILMIGPTGCGKTLLLKTIARILDVPFAIGDATTFTQAGYVGNDVESVLTTLLASADYNVERAQKGIVFIDEFDKIRRAGAGPSITRDVNGEGVQQALLKMIEGSECLIPADGSTRKHPHQQTIQFDTSNVLFVFGGSFDGLADVIRKRVTKHSSLGFSGKVYAKTDEVNVNDYFPLVSTKDLIDYGVIPEILGRIPIRVTLNELNKEELKRVLIEPKNSVIKQYKFSFQLDGATLTFDDGCYDSIVERAIKRKVGARGLRSIVVELVKDEQFNLPENVLEGKTEVYFTRKIAENIFQNIDKATEGECA